MTAASAYIGRAIEIARELVYGKAAILELYSVIGIVWTKEFELRENWLVTHGNGPFAHEWRISLYGFEWDDIKKCAAVKLKTSGQTLTFKLGAIERHVDGNRLCASLQMIGDQS